MPSRPWPFQWLTFVYYRGYTYWLTEGSGEFPSVQQYKLGMGKVGKSGKGRNEGYGSGWSWQTCQLYTTPGFQTFSSGKVIFQLCEL